jgi:hypothetical protein
VVWSLCPRKYRTSSSLQARPHDPGDEAGGARVPQVVETHVAVDRCALRQPGPALGGSVRGSVVTAVPAERVALRVEPAAWRREDRPARSCSRGRQRSNASRAGSRSRMRRTRPVFVLVFQDAAITSAGRSPASSKRAHVRAMSSPRRRPQGHTQRATRVDAQRRSMRSFAYRSPRRGRKSMERVSAQLGARPSQRTFPYDASALGLLARECMLDPAYDVGHGQRAFARHGRHHDPHIHDQKPEKTTGRSDRPCRRRRQRAR